jgi:hypothetical protein
MTVIYHYNACYIQRLLSISILCVLWSKVAMKLPPQDCGTSLSQHEHMHSEAGSITRISWSLQKHVLKSIYIWQVYTRYIIVYVCHINSAGLFLFSCSAAARIRACLVSSARWDASDLDFLLNLSVLVTKSPSIQSWGLTKFHIHGVTHACSLACTVATKFKSLLIS